MPRASQGDSMRPAGGTSPALVSPAVMVALDTDLKGLGMCPFILGAQWGA